MNAVALGLELVDQPLRLGCLAPTDADRVAALGKTPGHGRADGVACADQYCYAASFRHDRSLISSELVPY
jgi:hypothetical protein